MIDSSAFRKYDRMTGRQEYDRTKDRQRILSKYMIDCVMNRGNWGPVSKYNGFGVHSMNKTGDERKMFITRASAASAQHLLSIFSAPSQYLLSTFSSPCFGVKNVYNYGH